MPKPSKQIIIDAIIKEIEQGSGRGDVVAKYCKKFQKSARTIDTYWKTANEQYKAKQDLIKKEVLEVDKGVAIEARKSGLKSKLEKQVELQNEIDLIDKQIKGEVEFTFVVGNKVNKSHNGDIFMLPVQIQNELRARKLQYYAELNKMEGDYAVTKTEVTGKDGKDLVPQLQIEIIDSRTQVEGQDTD